MPEPWRILRFPGLAKRIGAATVRQSAGLMVAVALFSLGYFRPCAATPDILEMTLPEAVLLAVRDNTALRNAYLDRVVDKYSLWVAEGRFVPQAKLTAGLERVVARPINGMDTRYDRARLTPEVTWKAPTGADFRFGWDNSRTSLGHRSPSGQVPGNDSALTIDMTQPLLKGGGLEINRLPLELARNEDTMRLESLRDTLSNTIGEVIRAYRGLMLERGRLEIEERAVERARRLLETNRELIAAGRMAAQEMVQAEADLASREVNLASAENTLDQARLRLIELLNLDTDARIDPIEPIQVTDITLDEARLLAIALERRPDYRRALLLVENQRMNKQLAENGSAWELNLVARHTLNSHPSRWLDPVPNDPYGQDWSIGVDLVIPLFDRSQREQQVRADISLRQAANNLEELRQRISREVANQVRDIEIKRRQVDLALRSRELAERQLDVERVKLNLGRSTNFQVVQFQNELVIQQTKEISTIADYLNALTALDNTLGSTLDTWRIEIARLPMADRR